ncbi:hypothetical protein [Haloechinothrix sp. LS1_15]|uniref:hypothetical protein n=1 Tax=Haloechinothrix sp. LS1_15 TaxID=2652248 RepID=UPI00294ABB22|nr:hypothetical protein [Haloechinothrix sp. LS1_15]
MLNLFIAVVVSAMEDQMRADMREQEEQHAAEQAAANQRILDELHALRHEVEALRQRQD